MPYFPENFSLMAQFKSFDELDFTKLPYLNLLDQGRLDLGSLHEVGISYIESRTGSNSADHRSFVGSGKATPYLKRVYIGDELVARRKKRYYRKDGNLHFRIDVSYRKKKIFANTTLYRYEQYRLKQNGTYLKPNPLNYHRGTFSVFPKNYLWEAIQHTYEPSSGYDGGSIVKGSSVGQLEHTLNNPRSIPPSESNFTLRAGSQNMAPLQPASLDVPEEAKSRALIRLYEKILDETPNYYTVLAESGETLNTLRSIALKGLDLAQDLYRLNFKSISQSFKDSNLKTAADTWLSWIYSISPTVSDIKGTVELIARTNRVWRTYSAGVSAGSYVGPGETMLDGKSEFVFERYCRYGCTLEGNMSLSRYLARAQSWEQTAATVYEVIPFSFMLDWIVDISGYLNAVNVVDGRLIDAWYTEGIRQYTYAEGFPLVIDPTGAPYPGTYRELDWVVKPRLTIVRDLIVCRRSVLADLPDMPKPIVPTSAQLFDGISLQRGINALAIAVSRSYGLKDKWSRSLNQDRREIPLNLLGH